MFRQFADGRKPRSNNPSRLDPAPVAGSFFGVRPAAGRLQKQRLSTESAMHSVTAFAPASVGNVGVGFDVLGHALEGIGDTVTLRERTGPGIVFGVVEGLVPDLPRAPEANSASRPLIRMMRDHGITSGVEVSLHKGIPLGSGMGGSAASAVAAVVAADALWELDLEDGDLLRYALEGEDAASGAGHPDNAAASLLGGLVLAEPGTPPRCTRLPVPPGISCVLCHPDLEVRTRDARRILSPTVPIDAWVRQSAWLAGFVAGCLRGDLEQITRCLRDEIIWPQRAALVPGAQEAVAAARSAGALGGSLSGSGPSVFAWAPDECAAEVAEAFQASFAARGIGSQAWISRPDAPGARLLQGD
jgi:homoserine kinase